jgi:hypothetical protein
MPAARAEPERRRWLSEGVEASARRLLARLRTAG